MSEYRNFLFTVIAATLVLIATIFYIVTSIEPNIYWVIGTALLVGLTITFIFSLILFPFARLRSFETPKEMYRRQLRRAAILGFLAIIAILVQKFFDVL
jgi:hypothetical protein